MCFINKCFPQSLDRSIKKNCTLEKGIFITALVVSLLVTMLLVPGVLGISGHFTGNAFLKPIVNACTMKGVIGMTSTGGISGLIFLSLLVFLVIKNRKKDRLKEDVDFVRVGRCKVNILKVSEEEIQYKTEDMAKACFAVMYLNKTEKYVVAHREFEDRFRKSFNTIGEVKNFISTDLVGYTPEADYTIAD